MWKANVKVLYFILIKVNKLACVSIYWHNFTSLLIQIDPLFPLRTGTVQLSNSACASNRTFAISEITTVNEYVLLFSAVVSYFPAVTIPELASCTNFLHFRTAENIG
jgi:hypothetical protein